MAKTTKPSRMVRAMLETADDMRRAGIMDEMTHAKITLRHLGDRTDLVTEPISGEDIRRLREKADMSQAVFARYLNLTVGYPHVRLCVQRRLACSAGDSPAGVEVRAP